MRSRDEYHRDERTRVGLGRVARPRRARDRRATASSPPAARASDNGVHHLVSILSSPCRRSRVCIVLVAMNGQERTQSTQAREQASALAVSVHCMPSLATRVRAHAHASCTPPLLTDHRTCTQAPDASQNVRRSDNCTRIVACGACAHAASRPRASRPSAPLSAQSLHAHVQTLPAQPVRLAQRSI